MGRMTTGDHLMPTAVSCHNDKGTKMDHFPLSPSQARGIQGMSTLSKDLANNCQFSYPNTKFLLWYVMIAKPNIWTH